MAAGPQVDPERGAERSGRNITRENTTRVSINIFNQKSGDSLQIRTSQRAKFSGPHFLHKGTSPFPGLLLCSQGTLTGLLGSQILL